jgi:hypothetical protein
MYESALSRSARRCFVSDRVFDPGEKYYSAIVQKGSELVRYDYAQDHWTGPNQETVGWWTSKVPAKDPSKNRFAPNHVLLDTLSSLLESSHQGPLAYLLGLQLLRRRIVSLVDDATESESETGDMLHLRSTAEEREFFVPVIALDHAESEHLQSQLIELLYTDD